MQPLVCRSSGNAAVYFFQMRVLVFLIALVLPTVVRADYEHLSPHQRVILESKSPPHAEAVFHFDAPSGPQFTATEKALQRERGAQVLPRVKQAFESGAADVRIPPGDYRFGQERHEGAKVIFPLGFENLQRDADDPFVIDATGATFWFDLDDNRNDHCRSPTSSCARPGAVCRREYASGDVASPEVVLIRDRLDAR